MQITTAYCSSGNFNRRKRAQELTQRKGLSLPQVALRYIVSQPYPCFVLTGTTRVEHLVENVRGVVGAKFSQEEVQWLTGDASDAGETKRN